MVDELAMDLIKELNSSENPQALIASTKFKDSHRRFTEIKEIVCSPSYPIGNLFQAELKTLSDNEKTENILIEDILKTMKQSVNDFTRLRLKTEIKHLADVGSDEKVTEQVCLKVVLRNPKHPLAAQIIQVLYTHVQGQRENANLNQRDKKILVMLYSYFNYTPIVSTASFLSFFQRPRQDQVYEQVKNALNTNQTPYKKVEQLLMILPEKPAPSKRGQFINAFLKMEEKLTFSPAKQLVP